MNTLKSFRGFLLIALLATGTTMMGCGTNLTGPDTDSGQQMQTPEEPVMSTSSDAEENNPI